MSRRTPSQIRHRFYVRTITTTIDETTDDPIDEHAEQPATGAWAPLQSSESDGQQGDLTLYAHHCTTGLDGTAQVRIPSGHYAGVWDLVGPAKFWDDGRTAFFEATIRRVT